MAEADSPGIEEALTSDEADRLAANRPGVSALYERYALLEFARRSYFERWQGYAFACLARAHCALDSVFVLGPNREADVAALTRILWEHVVTFAWLMIDPPNHYQRLLKWEHNQREKMQADASKFVADGPSMDLLTLVMIADGFDPSVPAAPETPQRAEQADAHWNPKFGRRYRFYLRHGYSTIFRAHSTSVHPTVMGLAPFCDMAPGAQFAVAPKRALNLRLDAEALVVFADALLVASATLGWPRTDEVLVTLFDGFPTDPPSGDSEEGSDA